MDSRKRRYIRFSRYCLGGIKCYSVEIGGWFMFHWHAGSCDDYVGWNRFFRLRCIYFYKWDLPLPYYRI